MGRANKGRKGAQAGEGAANGGQALQAPRASHLAVVARRLQQLHAALVVPQRAGGVALGSAAVAQAPAHGAQAAAQARQLLGASAARLCARQLRRQLVVAGAKAGARGGHVAGGDAPQAQLQQECGAAALAGHALGRRGAAAGAALQLPDGVAARMRLDVPVRLLCTKGVGAALGWMSG